jgi:hypothetical protein
LVIVIDAATPSGTGLKSRVCGLLLQRVEVLPGKLHQIACPVERYPTLDVDAAHVLVRRDDVELLGRFLPGLLRTDNRPAPSRGR